ncbi:DUF1795 domain-containing protein [Salmonella enterica]|nr:DUF1795 domain-containing protein [Salmonella enterica]HCM1853063.1 DcrB-related protein [Salmonella enterica subsp. salamae serovar 42:z29:-]EEP0974714.1 DUF1795 domain-containing protein [Salmonella enterica]EEP1006989.1 DUF1795 domain-containing protein [Salmonella enterica]EEP1011592.1 DUF1795 domain-containing protein [Salmonella enterica]
MQHYILPEGSLSLPDEQVQDTSITMLRFPTRGTALTVSRAPLEAGEDGRVQFLQQLEKVRNTKKHFVIREQRDITIGVNNSVSGIEVLSQFSQGNITISQYQFAGQCGDCMVIFCYSRTGAFTSKDNKHWRAVMDSFQPANN